MEGFKDYILRLLQSRQMDTKGKKSVLIDEFIRDEDNIFAYTQITTHQSNLINRFMYKMKIYDIVNSHFPIPNAMMNKAYAHTLNINQLGNNEIVYTEMGELEAYGLVYDSATATITGIPTKSGDIKVNLLFRLEGEPEDSELHSKPISLVINADPKSLWQNIASDKDRDEQWKIDNFWKPDNIDDFQPIGDKHIVVASKRGRSHANVGSFRDDDYAFADIDDTGWSIVCVADGAGSAKLSRQGSKIACDGIISYFKTNFNTEIQTKIDETLALYSTSIKDGDEKIIVEDQTLVVEETVESNTASTMVQPTPLQKATREIQLFLYENLGKAAFAVHKQLEKFATTQNASIKDLHSTLIFVLFKKYEFGYALFSFGVGDCPIGLLNKDCSEIKLMNWLDVGEFGGGTRFITMPEIFNHANFPTRFGFKLINDFSYLFLMTDGIYDPKFVVEANLEKLEKWQTFIDDLQGVNDDNAIVELKSDNTAIANQLSIWMDFWSPGNHDDRTLAIVF